MSKKARLPRALMLILALAFLFETWIWDSLVAVFTWIARSIPWQRIRRATKDIINRLPAVVAVLLFGVPVVVMEGGSAVSSGSRRARPRRDRDVPLWFPEISRGEPDRSHLRPHQRKADDAAVVRLALQEVRAAARSSRARSSSRTSGPRSRYLHELRVRLRALWRGYGLGAAAVRVRKNREKSKPFDTRPELD